MPKKKPRAQKQRPRIAAQVREYVGKHPTATRQKVATALGLKPVQVYGPYAKASYAAPLSRSECRKTFVSAVSLFSAEDILQVKRLGLSKVRGIVKLLEQLEGSNDG